VADSLFTSQTPAVEASDGGPGITTGTSFLPDVNGTITHVRFYAGASVAGTYTGLLWEVDSNDDGFGGTGTLLGSDVYPGAPTGGAWNLIELDPPVPVTAGVLYRVGMHNPSRYVATNGFFTTPPGLINGHLHAPEDGSDPVGLGSMRQGTFTIDVSPSYPRQAGASASYFIDVVFVPESTSAEGTAAVGLDLAVAASGARDSEGLAALGLGLAVAASGSSPNGGSAALSLNFALAGTGARESASSAALGLGLAVAASGLRDSLGASALGLNLRVSATGSNGDVGCPVLPFPFGPSLISGYPWSDRAVKSFPGGDCS
jgi:hypothetical protein